MSRHRTGFYQSIEYIGPRPQKPKKRNFFGGWVIIVITIAVSAWFGRPLLPFVKAAQEGGSRERADELATPLSHSNLLGDQLAASALAYSRQKISYDPSYYKISFPDGDIAPGRGAAADVIIRCFRKIGIDLQKEVNSDMTKHFRSYPQLWNAPGPDTNIDHRRIANLQRFFERNGQSLEISRNPADYQYGDIVVWTLANAEPHIGIIVPGPSNSPNEPWVIHHLADSVQWENALFDYKIESHLRYPSLEAH